jgi:Replication-relaxation
MNQHTTAARPAGRINITPASTCDNSLSLPTTVEPIPARPTPGRLRTLRSRLTDRDLSVLHSLAKLRLMTGGQVQRLHVADGSEATRARRARALLQRLSGLTLLVRLGRRVGGIRAGSSGFVYGLSGLGQAVIQVAGTYGKRRRRVWEVSPSFADHVLSVAELHVGLVEAQRREELELLVFEAEPPCWRRFPGAGGQTVIVKPDAFVRLGVGELEHSAFIEVDLGTESAPTVARKCQTYIAYWQSGIEQAQHEVFPRVRWLADSERAAQRIANVWSRLPVEVRHLFDVALLREAIPTLTDTARGGSMA